MGNHIKFQTLFIQCFFLCTCIHRFNTFFITKYLCTVTITIEVGGVTSKLELFFFLLRIFMDRTFVFIVHVSNLSMQFFFFRTSTFLLKGGTLSFFFGISILPVLLLLNFGAFIKQNKNYLNTSTMMPEQLN